MTVDLIMLLASGALLVLLTIPASAARSASGRLAWVAGNRDTSITDAPWVGRVQRSHRNMLENLLPFAIVVLVVEVTGHANDMTAMGAVTFFLGRIGYTIAYICGIPWVRSFFWVVGIVGMAIMLMQLF
jgi:uncharacterized MAPEG superfamily protein